MQWTRALDRHDTFELTDASLQNVFHAPPMQWVDDTVGITITGLKERRERFFQSCGACDVLRWNNPLPCSEIARSAEVDGGLLSRHPMQAHRSLRGGHQSDPKSNSLHTASVETLY